MNAYFALNTPQINENNINQFFMFLFAATFAVLVVFVLWHLVPILISRSRNKRAEKTKAERDIWFDVDESVLRRGSRQPKIPENTIEFFVCKLVFYEKDKHQLDVNILEAAGGDTFKQRPVYQAVMRLNKKAKSELGIDELLTRGKEKTALNAKYR